MKKRFKERVELHCHTTMSKMDGVTTPKEIIEFVEKSGMTAVAFTDHGNVMAFPNIQKQSKMYPQVKPIYGMEAYVVDDYKEIAQGGDEKLLLDRGVDIVDIESTGFSFEENKINQLQENFIEYIKKGKTYHTTILVKNEEGKKTLYKLITDSNCLFFQNKPKIPLSKLCENRKNLLIGSGCESGELFRTIIEGKSQQIIETIAKRYDFLEIQPISENRWMYEDDREVYVNCDNDLIYINKQIIELGNKLSIPVVATSDVHYLRPENSISYSVVLEARDYSNPMQERNLYFRTTQEMLEEFSYLGKEIAYEVVVKNSNIIAEQIETVIPLKNMQFKVKNDDANEQLEKLCIESLEKRFRIDDKKLFSAAKERMIYELKLVKEKEFANYLLLFYELMQKNHLSKSQYNLRGCAASSIICYLLGISHANPMDKEIPLNLEFFMRTYMNIQPDIVMNIDERIWESVANSTSELTGVKTAYQTSFYEHQGEREIELSIKGLAKYQNAIISDEQRKIIYANCKNVIKDKPSLRPRIMLIPREINETDYFPIEKDESGEKLIQFDYYDIDYMFETIHILCHENCELNARLEEITGYYPSDDDIRSKKFIDLFMNYEKCDKGDCKWTNLRLLDVLGHSYSKIIDVVETLQPKTVAEFVKVEGICLGTGTWRNNGKELFENKVANINSLIACKEDIYEEMLKYKMKKEIAFEITETVRKGKLCKRSELEELMIKHGVPNWYISSCKKIKYLFPRAHFADYIQMELRSLYYEINYPKEFYNIFMEVYGNEYYKV